ncbi:hypothetical protein Glove_180g77 [Diversispora epigaea]|uniref:Uncharacterized protein n=1 Tax=Diversispora epigaea TaxID=1348612 RepID=A0A397IRG2_9GLOM|nr:hypothetical protein Glove_180g77 [Diversispora epigaea]
MSKYTDLQINTFRIICEKTLSIWKLLRERKKSANELIAQISNYSLKSKPYDFEFVTGIHTELNNEGFEDAVTKTIFSFDDEIFDKNNESENQILNSQNFDLFFNVTDIELR